MQIGTAYAVLGSPSKRQKYDATYPVIRSEWRAYRMDLSSWQARQDLIAETARKRQEKQEQKRRDAAAAEQRRHRQAQLRQEHQELKRELEEAERELAFKRAQADKRLRKAASHDEPVQESEQDPLRSKWLAAQERNRQLAERARKAHAEAARERLRGLEEEQARRRQGSNTQHSDTDAGAENKQEDKSRQEHPEQPGTQTYGPQTEAEATAQTDRMR